MHCKSADHDSDFCPEFFLKDKKEDIGGDGGDGGDGDTEDPSKKFETRGYGGSTQYDLRREMNAFGIDA